jgi:LAS superfamily LD-carboxypeptidase LdcB
VWCADGRQIIVDGSIGGNVQALVNDAQAGGIGLCAKSGFRTYAEQVELRRAHCGNSEHAILHAPPSTCSPPTARPGTSNHEGGLAIDFSCHDGQPMTHASPCYRWLAAHAARYGLHNLPSEPWHWSVTGR